MEKNSNGPVDEKPQEISFLVRFLGGFAWLLCKLGLLKQRKPQDDDGHDIYPLF